MKTPEQNPVPFKRIRSLLPTRRPNIQNQEKEMENVIFFMHRGSCYMIFYDDISNPGMLDYPDTGDLIPISPEVMIMRIQEPHFP